MCSGHDARHSFPVPRSRSRTVQEPLSWMGEDMHYCNSACTIRNCTYDGMYMCTLYCRAEPQLSGPPLSGI